MSDPLVNLRKRRREKAAAGEDEFNITKAIIREVIIKECYNKFPHKEKYNTYNYVTEGEMVNI